MSIFDKLQFWKKDDLGSDFDLGSDSMGQQQNLGGSQQPLPMQNPGGGPMADPLGQPGQDPMQQGGNQPFNPGGFQGQQSYGQAVGQQDFGSGQDTFQNDPFGDTSGTAGMDDPFNTPQASSDMNAGRGMGTMGGSSDMGQSPFDQASGGQSQYGSTPSYGQPSQPGGQQDMGSMREANPFRPQGQSPFSQPDRSQPDQSMNQRQRSAGDVSQNELIISKLDTLRVMIDNINQRLSLMEEHQRKDRTRW